MTRKVFVFTVPCFMPKEKYDELRKEIIRQIDDGVVFVPAGFSYEVHKVQKKRWRARNENKKH